MNQASSLPTGRIVSVRVGRARAHPRPAWDQKHSSTWTSAYVKDEVPGPVHVSALGLAGDQQHDRRVHGGEQMAVLAYAAGHYPRWREELGIPEIGPGGFGENLVIEGLDEWSLCVGDVLEAGAARLQISQPRGPCANISRRWNREDLLGRVTANRRTGWYQRVLREGEIAVGDVVTLVERPQPDWTVERVLALRLAPAGDRAGVTFLANCPELSPEWRSKFRKLAD